MSFFSKFFLYFLPLISIPIIIHLWNKNRLKTVEFSSLKFLFKLKNDAIRKLKLRQLILLILRTLLILFIILFFARPYIISGNKSSYPQKGEELFLVVDNSHSMGEAYQDVTLLQKKLNTLKALGQYIDYPISANLILTTSPEEIQFRKKIDNALAFEQLLLNIDNSSHTSKLNKSLTTLTQYIKEKKILSPNIWVISDFQQQDHFTEDFTENLANIKGKMLLFPVTHKGSNNAIGQVRFPAQIIEQHKTVSMKTTVNYWQAFQAIKVALFIDNQKVAQDITKQDYPKIEFAFTPLESGGLTGRLELPADDHLLDNRYYFALDIPNKVRLLIVGNTSENKLLRSALNAGRESLFDITTISTDILAMENLTDYDVLIFHDVARLPAVYRDKLNHFAEQGKGIIYIPDIQTSIANYNQFWHQQMKFPKWEQNITGNGNTYLKIDAIDETHPIFNKIWTQQFESQAQFFAYPEVKVPPEYNVLVRYNNKKPFLTEKNNRILLSAFVDVENSNLRVSGFFPVLMQQSVLYLSNFNKSIENYQVGDTLTYANRLTESANFTMKTPRKKSYMLSADQSGLQFDQTPTPGHYQLYKDGQLLRQYAVNISPEETIGRFLSLQQLRQFIAPYKKSVALYDDDTEASGLETHKDLSNLLLMFILLLLIAETIIARINRNEPKRNQ